MSGPAPDGFWTLMQQWGQQALHASTLAFVGLAIGLGQLLHSKETLTVRLVIGRALTAGGLGMAAGAALAWAPDMPWIAQVGLAASIASLGTSGLERLASRLPIFGGGSQP